MTNKSYALTAIAAMSENRVIGKNNQLPWHLPADLRHFKRLTLNQHILMGRKTYLSIGRPLPQRTNIILTRDPHFQAPGCTVITAIDKILALAKEQEILIIGGAEIYTLLMPYITRIYLTIIHQVVDGDTFFPALNMQQWQQVSREDHSADAENQYQYSFLELRRI